MGRGRGGLRGARRVSGAARCGNADGARRVHRTADDHRPPIAPRRGRRSGERRAAAPLMPTRGWRTSIHPASAPPAVRPAARPPPAARAGVSGSRRDRTRRGHGARRILRTDRQTDVVLCVCELVSRDFRSGRGGRWRHLLLTTVHLRACRGESLRKGASGDVTASRHVGANRERRDAHGRAAKQGARIRRQFARNAHCAVLVDFYEAHPTDMVRQRN